MKTQPAATVKPVAQSPDRSRLRRYAPWLLIAVGLAVYANSLTAPFIADDANILHGQHLRTLWPLYRTIFAPPDTPDSGRPVITLSLLLNYAAGGLDVRGYRAVNVAVHLLAGLVLFGIVRRTLCTERLRTRFAAVSAPLAGVSALLWLVHPLQTECVDYVSQRSESIMGLFYLLTLYCAIRSSHSPHPRLWYVAAVSACALGMASKEAMVTAPLLVLLYDWAFRSEPFSVVFRKRWPLYAGLAATWLILAALMATGPRSLSVGFHLGASPLDYALHQCTMVVTYLRLAFWPHPLILDYGECRPVQLAQALPYAAALLAVLAATAVISWRKPPLAFLAAWVFLILAPTSTIVPIASEIGAERRMYLPLAAIIALVVAGTYLLLRRVFQRPAAATPRPAGPVPRLMLCTATVLVLLAATALGAATIRRNAEYHDPLHMWRSVTQRLPQNARAWFLRGVQHRERDQLDDAVASYRQALKLAPNRYDATHALANALMAQGQTAPAIENYRRALALARRPLERASVSNDLGRALLQAGHTREALQHWRAAASLKPDEAGLLNNLAWQLATHPDPSIRDAAEAVRLAELASNLTSHQEPAILDTLAAAYAAAGRFPEAIQTARTACALFPDSASAEPRARLELYLQSRPYYAPLP